MRPRTKAYFARAGLALATVALAAATVGFGILAIGPILGIYSTSATGMMATIGGVGAATCAVGTGKMVIDLSITHRAS